MSGVKLAYTSDIRQQYLRTQWQSEAVYHRPSFRGCLRVFLNFIGEAKYALTAEIWKMILQPHVAKTGQYEMRQQRIRYIQYTFMVWYLHLYVANNNECVYLNDSVTCGV